MHSLQLFGRFIYCKFITILVKGFLVSGYVAFHDFVSQNDIEKNHETFYTF